MVWHFVVIDYVVSYCGMEKTGADPDLVQFTGSLGHLANRVLDRFGASS